MIRITTVDEEAGTTITVDGTLSGEGIEPVESSCTQALAAGKPVRLYLRDVSSINESGRTMLRRLAAGGVSLSANGIYSAYIVHEIQSERAGGSSDAR